ncbi:hypothetical protein TVAG_476130 [Trichomonas vaginalis G3]|uniref:Protein-S-isoprenylcysteine O-methyltransferase n=1 Tax=Trichomonas vaginalis (strain ATCC PRA-98 / G3) TaxID=412133 RepID=A2DA36_TRIV3|nr:protein C-terminal S-isoprenylcysteine carboxyl O-methyltransferase protein [Trichomonas vaginalis G3]EAY22684.1 hypothetical protein TVAG_476130 [Trichomonas vaginalis G3]KAI5525498.1 protein C-terminal S-isoprenylcysteine carboxyl O-methyltransferase protein [Trichomonas vaginalis G3]|eukprot:XP_001583670.1 hypothetical protein [Trichomonas vaginalis G3]
MDYIFFTLLFVLICYHVAEYVIHKAIHPDITDKRSFLITWQYLVAFSVGCIEYFIESLKFYNFKHNKSNPMIWIGAFSIIIGLYIRFAAILHAGKAFTHQLSRAKRPDHKLVTDGIYKYIRHPGYLGFFIFAIGTQVFLSNILSPVAFAVTLWYFFKRRIADEEYTLYTFFGNDYLRYRSKTPTYFPFIE